MNGVLTAHGKRWNWGASALLTAFVMTVPTLVILLGGSTGTPVVWVRTAMAGLRQGNQLFPQHKFLHGFLSERLL
jgi:xyloglucan fucosyltransferase